MIRLLIAVLLSGASVTHAAETFTFSSKQGPHAVGLRIQQQYDRSRAYKNGVSLITGQPTSGERARPMQTLVWYPAEGGGKPVTFRDYLSLRASEADFTHTPDEVRRVTETMIANLRSRLPEASRVVAQPMWAVRDAPAQKGRFPVVIYAPSFSASASENADLCEYLASQGYIVLASASQGTRTRAMTDDLDGLEAQAADIGYLIAYAASLGNADTDRIAVAGFSWGGLANVLAAARDNRIKALVSLDGSVRYYPQMVDGGKDAARYVSAAQLPVPMLYVSRRAPSMEELNRKGNSTGFSLLNEMKYSDVMVVTMQPMLHSHFASDGLRFTPDNQFGDYTQAEVSTAYSWMAQYVHRFLDAYLKNDPAARGFIANKPRDNGAPAHMVAVDMRPGGGAPPTRESFARQLAARGFDKAASIHADMKSQGARFALEPHDLNTWGYELLGRGMVTEAIAIFRFGTQLHPADANLFDSLGEAEATGGLREDAIRSYRHSLALNPANTNAVERLKLLRAPAEKPGPVPGPASAH
ncbi:MAG TPA: dienelactone hydrolase family protein [Telluria sp.]|nr:dienelactone hydrolase family protein [Telluria sp.]